MTHPAIDRYNAVRDAEAEATRYALRTAWNNRRLADTLYRMYPTDANWQSLLHYAAEYAEAVRAQNSIDANK